jgi:hypothetical protein
MKNIKAKYRLKRHKFVNFYFRTIASVALATVTTFIIIELPLKAGAMAFSVRKSATSLTDTEIDNFITAVTTLKNTTTTDGNGNPTNLYDQFVAIHPAVTRLQGFANVDGAHGNAAFLPWHRE